MLYEIDFSYQNPNCNINPPPGSLKFIEGATRNFQAFSRSSYFCTRSSGDLKSQTIGATISIERKAIPVARYNHPKPFPKTFVAVSS